MYDPIKRTAALEKYACQDNQRKYYRFRPAKWYGGIVTGDVTVCNLLCHFCWAGDDIRTIPEQVGKFYTPEQAFSKLDAIARKKGFSQMRLSGQEPTIGREHLLELLGLIGKTKYRFILETNGLLIGSEKDYADDLASFKNLHVRVSIKGATEEEFSMLTDSRPEFFRLQLDALKNLIDADISVHPAVMVSFSSEENIATFLHRLEEIQTGLSRQMEVEELILYPHVVKRLKKTGVSFGTAHEPDKVPEKLL